MVDARAAFDRVPFCSPGPRLLARPSPAFAQTGTRRPPRRPRPSGSTRRPTSPGSRRRPPTTCWPRCRASPSGAPTQRARPRPGVGKRADQRPAHRQQVGRRDRPAAAHPGRNVERIEIVDAASLGIAGLSGQVANIILKRRPKAAGQFEWNPSFRAHFTKPELIGGSVSYSGKTGPVDYTLSVKNESGPRRLRRPGPDLRRQPTSDRDGATKSTTPNIEKANMQAEVRARRPGLVGRQSDARLHSLLEPEFIRDRRVLRRPASGAAATTAPSSTAITPTSTAIMSSRSGPAG